MNTMPLPQRELSENETRDGAGTSPAGGTILSQQSSSSTSTVGGRWGEQNNVEPVSRHQAMEDFAEMQKELTRFTQKSRASNKDIEAGSTDSTLAESDFELGEFLKDGHLERRTTTGASAKRIGVVFKNLTVKGVDASSSFVKTLPQAVFGSFGPDLYNIICHFVPALRFGKTPPTRQLLRDFSGVVRDGEMMLVLGRPGAGCTTFLKAIANDRSSFASVEGDVTYGDISSRSQDKHFRGEVNYNPEDDLHFPNLTVEQTLRFALLNKTKLHDKAGIPIIVDGLLKMFGISHTRNTPVGNEFLRGVSGGERKRVSIAETLTTKSSVVCWDNSTRGLDASIALDYVKSLRIMTDISNRTTFVTLYQAGQGIYDLMDKVMLIEDGRMLYQGPAKKAKGYFEGLGFYCPERSTTADFLTSLCDPKVRQFQPGCEASTPKSPEELEAAFRSSELFHDLSEDVNGYEKNIQDTEGADTRVFERHVGESKSKTVSKRSNYTVSFVRQVLSCTKRQFWLFWGDKPSLYTKAFVIISNAFIISSLFYGQSLDTSGAFSRGGSLFFSILFLAWLQLSELMAAVSGRTVVARHKDYAFYRPSAVVIARVIVDFPILLAMTILWSIPMFFLTQHDMEASKFFIYALFIYLSALSLTAMYRMFAAISPTINDAIRFGGIALNVLFIYVGYLIPKRTLMNESPWFGWIQYVNPVSYSYEAVMTNEFSNREMECAPEQLVPNGPGIDPRYQGCTLPGSELGSRTVSGARYLETTFQYSRSNLWRNFGVVIAFTVLYILVTAIASESFSFASGGGGALVFKKSRRTEHIDALQRQSQSNDEEKANTEPVTSTAMAPSSAKDHVAQNKGLATSDRVFAWKDVEYTVPYGNGERKLLNKISGYVRPGMMIALMGASGSGKTTLLNTLSQRQSIGVVSGETTVDGRPLPPDFQRSTGFCEQMDIHDGTATIREALEFSAILRQSRDIPRHKKIEYVDEVIGLLELEEIQDAIIDSLSVEQRKRLTIGVELAAKPSLLLFLDEPTSGLDSEAAFSIVRFLKKLSRAGQAIICTIHQPSSMLIQEFDNILALNPGGNAFYFGPVGENGSAVVDYFAERGVVCPPTKNVAEFILETAAKSRKVNGKTIDWNEEWRTSQQYQQLRRDIDQIKSERSQVPPPESDNNQLEFASSVSLQCYMLTQRLFRNYWRDPSYIYGKIFVCFVIGIFNGFTFYDIGNSVANLQDRMFSIFMIILLPAVIMNGVLPKFYANRMLWESRELPSRIYGWFAFCTANVVCEIPYAVVTCIIYWLVWYYPTGLPRDTSTAGYVFLMSLLFFFFQASWGQWICAFAPSFTVISNTLPFFLVMVNLFNGIIRPYASINVFWRYWMYYLNPITWWLRGVLSAIYPSLSVECADFEFTHFNPPPDTTCADHTNTFIGDIARAGYLRNPSAMSDCEYCPYKAGDEFMRTLNVQDGDKWRSFGIFLAFVIINWALVYFMIYTVRVKRWTFGMGFLFGGLEKMADRAKALFRGKEETKIED